MPLDKWGLKFIYPTKQDGFTWFQKDDIKDDEHYESDEVGDSGGGQFTINFSGPTSGVIYTDRSFENTNSIGGCNMNFEDTANRGYIYKSDDPRDVEITWIMGDVDIGDHGFSVSGPTGKHSGSGCCSGFAYMMNLETTTDPIDFRFRKEMWHVSYHTDPETGTFNHSKFNFKLQNRNTNTGFKYVRYNKKDGADSGHNVDDSVVLEMWGNPDPDDDPLNWVLIKRTEDKGGWGNDGDQCNGDDDQIGTWAGPKFRMKSNGNGSITFKHVSLREIDASKDFDSPPTPDPTTPPVPPVPNQPPTTTTIVGSFRLQRDINIASTSVCAATGLKTFYNRASTGDDDVENDALTSDQERTRVGNRAINSNSVMIGKIIKQVDVYLRKQGSPGASPTVDCKIFDNGGTLKYTSTTHFDPSSFTTSYVFKAFDCTTNTYAMQTGDRVVIEYTGSSAVDFVEIPVFSSNPQTNEQLSVYGGGEWRDPADRDFNGKLYESG
jgi:hypothetical protein